MQLHWLHRNEVFAKLMDLLSNLGFDAIADANDRDNRCHADNNAEHGPKITQLGRAHRVYTGLKMPARYRFHALTCLRRSDVLDFLALALLIILRSPRLGAPCLLGRAFINAETPAKSSSSVMTGRV